MDDAVLVKELHPPEDLDHEHLVVLPGQHLLVGGWVVGWDGEGYISAPYNDPPPF